MGVCVRVCACVMKMAVGMGQCGKRRHSPPSTSTCAASARHGCATLVHAMCGTHSCRAASEEVLRPSVVLLVAEGMPGKGGEVTLGAPSSLASLRPKIPSTSSVTSRSCTGGPSTSEGASNRVVIHRALHAMQKGPRPCDPTTMRNGCSTHLESSRLGSCFRPPIFGCLVLCFASRLAAYEQLNTNIAMGCAC